MPDDFESLASRGLKVLWVVSSGGHLVQALEVERQLGINAESIWLTSDVPQARSLLEGRVATYLPYVAPRDFIGAARASTVALKIARDYRVDQVISTGAAIAGLALPRLARRGIPATFIESVARRNSVSLTGRIARISPGVRTLTQYQDRKRPGWDYDGTILSNWIATPSAVNSKEPLKVFVTLGTIKPYRFDSGVDAVLDLLHESDDVVWQLGETTRSDLPGTTHRSLGTDEMREYLRWADVVVCHAGVGSILDSLQAGKAPVLLVREASRGEHVDDHQRDISAEMVTRGLGFVLDVDAARRSVLEKARSLAVRKAKPA